MGGLRGGRPPIGVMGRGTVACARVSSGTGARRTTSVSAGMASRSGGTASRTAGGRADGTQEIGEFDDVEERNVTRWCPLPGTT
jgi:hypothetical protein